MRAQVAMEYLMIIGFSLMLLIPLLALFSSTFNSDQTFLLNQASEMSRDISGVAERTFFQGVGSKQVISVRVPRGYASFEANNVGAPATGFQNTELNRTGFFFETSQGYTVTHAARVPINFIDVDLSQPGVYNLVVETKTIGGQLNINDFYVEIRRQ